MQIFARIACKYPSADGVLDMLSDMPDPQLPDYWYELEPHPKSKRLYWDKDHSALVEKFQRFGAFGTLHNARYTLNIDGFPSDAPVSAEVANRGMLFFHPPEVVKDHQEQLDSILTPFKHALSKLDVYYANISSVPEISAFADQRRSELAKNPPKHFDPAHLPGSGDFANAKLGFPGLYWQTVLSEECLTDYGLALQNLREAALHHEEISGGGTSGALHLLRFFDDPTDFAAHTNKLINLNSVADRHRYLMHVHYQLREEDHLNAQRWHEWAYSAPKDWPVDLDHPGFSWDKDSGP